MHAFIWILMAAIIFGSLIIGYLVYERRQKVASKVAQERARENFYGMDSDLGDIFQGLHDLGDIP